MVESAHIAIGERNMANAALSIIGMFCGRAPASSKLKLYHPPGTVYFSPDLGRTVHGDYPQKPAVPVVYEVNDPSGPCDC